MDIKVKSVKICEICVKKEKRSRRIKIRVFALANPFYQRTKYITMDLHDQLINLFPDHQEPEPEEIQEEDIVAKYDKGILNLFIPKEGSNKKVLKYIDIQ